MSPDAICMGCMGDRGAEECCPNCGWREGTRPDNPQQLAPRTILQEKYLLGRVLGQGGFGITYLAWDLNLNRKLAVKEYFPSSISTRTGDRSTVSPLRSNRNDFEYGLRKFAEEGRALARFKGSPGIVSIFDFFHGNGTAYIVMAYVEGLTFKQYLQEKDGKILFQEALEVLIPVMDALEELHGMRMLHRDISPDNIYLEQNGSVKKVKILDFGSTRSAMGEHSQIPPFKPGYTPIEQYSSSGEQRAWTDIYALGATFYRAITGKVPPESLDRLAHDELLPPSRLGVKIPSKCEQALLKALSVRAGDRFQTIADFRRAISTSPRLTSEKKPPSSMPSPIGPMHLSKAFYVTSLVVGFGVSFIIGVGAAKDPEVTVLLVFPVSFLVVVFLILLYRMWKSIQDGYARTTPGKAVGFLFIPFFNLYWLFQVIWGFSKDYNKFIDRHFLRVSRLSEGLFLATSITYPCVLFLGFVPGLGLMLSLTNMLLLLTVVAKACDAVNNISQKLPEAVIAPAKALLLRCIFGEFAGNDIELGPQEILIGRSPARSNLVLSSDQVSDKHVRVWLEAGNDGIWVEDLESEKGTFYQGPALGGVKTQWVRLSGKKLLAPGARIRIGMEEFEVGRGGIASLARNG